MPRRTKTTAIDPIALTIAALKAVKVASDFHRLGSTTEQATLESAWNQLSPEEMQRITEIVNADTQASPEQLAEELAACGNLIQLKAIKAEHGEAAVKAAWKLLPRSERDRLTALCQPTPSPAPEPTAKPRTLLQLTADLQQLDTLLDSIENDIPPDLQQAVDDLLNHRDATIEQLMEKIDNYVALIQSRFYWASIRKAEAERLAKLAESDQKTIDFLKGRLKAHMEQTDRKQIRTRRFNISLCSNGGKLPLHLEGSPEEIPERFQRQRIEADRESMRQALEAGEELTFAHLGARETHLRIS